MIPDVTLFGVENDLLFGGIRYLASKHMWFTIIRLAIIDGRLSYGRRSFEPRQHFIVKIYFRHPFLPYITVNHWSRRVLFVAKAYSEASSV